MRIALYRTFISPAVTRALAPAAPMLATIPPRYSVPIAVIPHAGFSSATVRLNKYKTDMEDLPRDHDITANEIMIVDNRGMTGPKRTAQVLRMLDLEEYSLRMVANPGGQLPICKVVHIATEEKRVKKEVLAQKKKAKKKSLKSIDINWGTTQYDLKYRMKQLKGFLDKGYMVYVKLVRKRRKDEATAEHQEKVKEWVREAIKEADGILQKEINEEKGAVRFNVEPKVFKKKVVMDEEGEDGEDGLETGEMETEMDQEADLKTNPEVNTETGAEESQRG